MAHVIARRFDGSLAEQLERPRRDGVTLYWLGQAGFVIDTPGLRIVIDPYLSNSLETKYHGTVFPHLRMAPAPLTPDELGNVDLVLCTHHHTDHLDGETLRPLAERLPGLRFVVPAASLEIAHQRIGVAIDRLIGADAGDVLARPSGLRITVLRAAHEALETDGAGRHKFLGFGLEVRDHRILHSGDTIPFEGQSDEIMAFAPHIALFPVNGRSQILRKAGFAGNMSLAEAMEMAGRCEVPSMIAHHHGMFAFNTVDPSAIDQAIGPAAIQLLRADYETAFESVL